MVRLGAVRDSCFFGVAVLLVCGVFGCEVCRFCWFMFVMVVLMRCLLCLCSYVVFMLLLFSLRFSACHLVLVVCPALGCYCVLFWFLLVQFFVVRVICLVCGVGGAFDVGLIFCFFLCF